MENSELREIQNEAKLEAIKKLYVEESKNSEEMLEKFAEKEICGIAKDLLIKNRGKLDGVVDNEEQLKILNGRINDFTKRLEPVANIYSTDLPEKYLLQKQYLFNLANKLITEFNLIPEIDSQGKLSFKRVGRIGGFYN